MGPADRCRRPMLGLLGCFGRLLFESNFQCVFHSVFVTFWLPKWTKHRQQTTKMDAKTHFDLGSVFRSISDRCWLPKRTPRTPKLSKFHYVLFTLADLGVFVLMSVLAPTLVPTWLHFGINMLKNLSKKPSKKHPEFDWCFFIVFLNILAPCWDPFWNQLGHFGSTNERSS